MALDDEAERGELAGPVAENGPLGLYALLRPVKALLRHMACRLSMAPPSCCLAMGHNSIERWTSLATLPSHRAGRFITAPLKPAAPLSTAPEVHLLGGAGQFR